MSKKSFGAAIKTSVTKQKESLDDRFATADSVLLGGGEPAGTKKPASPAAKVAPGRKQAPASRRRPRAGQGAAERRSAAATSALNASSETVARDSFTCPQSEHAAIERARLKLARKGLISQKSEVIRIALQLLDALTPAELAQAYKGLAKIKPGRKTGPMEGRA